MIIKILLLWSCGLLLLLILGQCFVPNKTCKNKALSLLAIICGVWLGNATLHFFGAHQVIPHLNKIHIPFVCISGTCWYLYVKCFLGIHIFKAIDFVHLLPAVLCILLGLPFYLEPAEFKLNYVETELISLSSILMYIASRISEINCFIYIMLALLLIYRQLSIDKKVVSKKTHWILFCITVIALLTLILRTLGSISNIGFIGIALPSIIIFFLFTILYSFSYYNPSVLGISELKKTKGKSKETHFVDNIEKQMALYKEIIEKDEIYLDPDISLTELAKQLHTQPYILSEVINASMNMNFNKFINGLRIKHAAQLLVQDETKSVLDIAYESGFNSKSVFYKHFSESKLMTPVQYRKLHLKKNSYM